MKKKVPSLSLAALLTAGSAWSADIEGIGGNYVGKVSDATSVPSKKGDACEATIDPKAKANTAMFRLNGRELYIERDTVKQRLASGKKKVKLESAGEKGGKVFVVLGFSGEQLNLVRLRIVSHKKNWTIACNNLQRS